MDQVITEISNNKDEVLVKGFFKDCEDSNYAVIFIIGQRSLKLRVESHSKIYNRIKVSFENCEDNYYYGLGEQFSHLILGKNRPYSMFVREKGVGRT